MRTWAPNFKTAGIKLDPPFNPEADKPGLLALFNCMSTQCFHSVRGIVAAYMHA